MARAEMESSESFLGQKVFLTNGFPNFNPFSLVETKTKQ